MDELGEKVKTTAAGSDFSEIGDSLASCLQHALPADSSKSQVKNAIQLDEQCTAREHTQSAIKAFPLAIRDWTKITFTALDRKGTFRHEDMFSVRGIAEGILNCKLVVPAFFNRIGFFKPGMECIAIGIETNIHPNGRIETIDAGLVAAKLSNHINTDITDLALAQAYGNKKTNHGLTKPVLNQLFLISQAAEKSAACSLANGIGVVKKPIQKDCSAQTGILSAEDMITELIMMKQRALAFSLSFQNIAVLTSPGRVNFSEYPNYHALHDSSRISRYDRAPFKKSHGSVAWKINQTQIIAASLGVEPYTSKEISKLANRLNRVSSTGDRKIIEGIEWVYRKRELLENILAEVIQAVI